MNNPKGTPSLCLTLVLCLVSLFLMLETEKHNLPVAFIKNKEMARVCAEFLAVMPDALEKAMCTKSTIAHGEVIISPISSSVACNVRDAFVKGIYGRLFIWIVQSINKAIYKPPVSQLEHAVCDNNECKNNRYIIHVVYIYVHIHVPYNF